MAATDMGSYFPSQSKLRPSELPAALRVLFVDESPENVTALIHRVANRKQWEITHAATAAAAREIAGKQPVDVALISATLPETNISDLANYLTQLHPKLTVFILADDPGAVEQSHASGRFQWFGKTADPGSLALAIERMTSLVSWLSNNTTLELVSGIHALPTIPSNYQGVIRTIHSPHSSIQDIGDAVEKDMGMTSRVLQVANSAYYGFSKKITSPTEAALLIGIETLKSLVRYTHVLNNFPQTPGSSAIFDKVWRHSLGVGSVARKITLLHTQDETVAEEAFTAGLLHDIGKLVLMSMKVEEYRELMRQAAESKTAVHLLERVKLGTTHAETGAYLLSLWGIPFGILEAVAWHHFPGECREKVFSPLTAVHIANVAEHRRTNPDHSKAVPPLDERYLAEVGVTKHLEEWLKIAPDQPKREEDLSNTPYVVQPAAPAPPPKEGVSPWIWVLVAGAAIALIWFLFF